MKEAIAILTGGGPAPGMNTVVGSVAKRSLPRVSRDRSALRLFGSFQSLAPLRRPDFHAGRLHLQSGRFVPHDEPFQTDRQGFRGEFQPQFLHREQRQAARDRRRDDTASTANRIAKFLEAKHYPIANIHVPKTIDNDLPLPAARRRSATSRPRRAERSSAALSTTTHARRPTGSS